MILRAVIASLALLACPASAETLTAARLVRPMTIISADDLSVSETDVPGALGSDAQILGLEAKTTLYPGHPIRPQDVGPPALVERNQLVMVVYKSGALTISAEARALSRGGVGEVIRVMNLTSRKTVSGRIEPDGTVAVSP